MDTNDLINRFGFHPATDDITKARHEAVRDGCLALAIEINDLAPEGREKSLAITHLEESMMWANAAIARST